MIVAMQETATDEQIQQVVEHLIPDGLSVHRTTGERQTVLAAVGAQIATMGTAHGLYDAHLHLEIRKNLEIGMSRAKFARDFNNYYDPSQFIASHRHLQMSREKFRVAMNTFK